MNACNSDGVAALILALQAWKDLLPYESAENCQSSGELVREILGRGADPNVQDQAGLTPLHGAIVEKNSELVREERVDQALIHQLVEAGAYVDPPPNPKVPWPTTPLMLAVRAERVDIVNLLISLGAHVNTTIGDDTPLMTGLCTGGELFPHRVSAVVTTLLEHEVDVKADERRILSSAISHVPESVERFLSECYGEPGINEELVYVRKRAPEGGAPVSAPVLFPSLKTSNDESDHDLKAECLCSSCRAFEKNAVYREWFFHSENSEAVDRSISAGCGMCRLIKDCLLNTFGVVSLYYYSALSEADTLSRDYFERIIVRAQKLIDGENRYYNYHFGELRLAAVDGQCSGPQS